MRNEHKKWTFPFVIKRRVTSRQYRVVSSIIDSDELANLISFIIETVPCDA